MAAGLGLRWDFIKHVGRSGWLPCRLGYRAIADHKAVQRLGEVAPLIAMVKEIRPSVVVEVGTRHGGTFSCWPSVAAPDATLVSIDLPAGEFGGGSGEEVLEKLRGLVGPTQTLHCLRQDSHAPESLAWLQEVLSGRPIDFLFLDGDHSLAGITQDFDTFGPLVRPGGLVAFHDIVPEPDNRHIEVPEFWRTVREGRRFHEFIDPPARSVGGMGIGVLRM